MNIESVENRLSKEVNIDQKEQVLRRILGTTAFSIDQLQALLRLDSVQRYIGLQSIVLKKIEHEEMFQSNEKEQSKHLWKKLLAVIGFGI